MTAVSRPADAGAERGRDARRVAPRTSHADLPDRTGPPALEVLAAQDPGRVADLLPLRYARMAQSPFAFFRGAAAVMAADLADTPVSGIHAQLCGDAHLANFGFFASPERRLVFDVNDFDETLPGPWEWDVKRLAASVEVSGRESGFSRGERTRAVTAAVRTYRETMRRFATLPTLDVWYAVADVERVRIEAERGLSAAGRRAAQRGVSKARTRDNLGALGRFARIVDGEPRIVAEPPLVVPLRDLVGPDRASGAGIGEMIGGLLTGYRETLPAERRHLLDRYRLTDIAHKVVGVGSVGTRCWMLLLTGRDVGDPLFLQAKEAGPSVLEPLLGPAVQRHAGQRVVQGQRLMQAVSDIFLGWQSSAGLDGVPRQIYLRQLRDWKGAVDVDRLDPSGTAAYARLCGWTLARAHARSGDRLAVAAYLGASGKFDDAVVRFARAYADRTEQDHAALVAAIADGRVAAAPEP